MNPLSLVTDIAGEMDALTETFRDCKACLKACTAAVDMLAVRASIFLNILRMQTDTLSTISRCSINAKDYPEDWINFQTSIDSGV